MTRSRRAFTLIKLSVVVMIVAILAGQAFPVFSGMQEKARSTQTWTAFKTGSVGMGEDANHRWTPARPP